MEVTTSHAQCCSTVALQYRSEVTGTLWHVTHVTQTFDDYQKAGDNIYYFSEATGAYTTSWESAPAGRTGVVLTTTLFNKQGLQQVSVSRHAYLLLLQTAWSGIAA